MTKRYRLAAVFAHPDDDTFALSGTLLAEPDLIESYTVIVATSGEAGLIADASAVAREDLADTREQEERNALALAGQPDAALHFLRLPDGGLADVAMDELVGRIVPLLVEARPHVVVTFGPDGITQHTDHMTVHDAATRAFHRAREEAADPEALLRLSYNEIPQSRLDFFWQTLRSRGVDVDPDAPFMPHGVPDETMAVRVDCSGVFERKFEALRAHRTQAEEIETFPRDLRSEIFGTEWFVQAWPAAAPGGDPAPSLFAGLP
jgi:LmbE family N-acetylglucosaminyl deacetylase